MKNSARRIREEKIRRTNGTREEVDVCVLPMDILPSPGIAIVARIYGVQHKYMWKMAAGVKSHSLEITLKRASKCRKHFVLRKNEIEFEKLKKKTR